MPSNWARKILKVGEERDLDALCSHWVACGFDRVATIDGIGQFSLRAASSTYILSALSIPTAASSLAMRSNPSAAFDVSTQRSLSTCEEAWVLPAARGAARFSPLRRLPPAIEAAGAAKALNPLKDQLELGESLDGIECYTSLLYAADDGFFEYLKEPVLFLEEREEITAALDKAISPSRAKSTSGRGTKNRCCPHRHSCATGIGSSRS